ncbi:hypothetical protein KEM55_003627 [Ascosphaera atra]|nr:hypothetical protein KEM55_003627 [Ascosphaera atra]
MSAEEFAKLRDEVTVKLGAWAKEEKKHTATEQKEEKEKRKAKQPEDTCKVEEQKEGKEKEPQGQIDDHLATAASATNSNPILLQPMQDIRDELRNLTEQSKHIVSAIDRVTDVQAAGQDNMKSAQTPERVNKSKLDEGDEQSEQSGKKLCQSSPPPAMSENDHVASAPPIIPTDPALIEEDMSLEDDIRESIESDETNYENPLKRVRHKRLKHLGALELEEREKPFELALRHELRWCMLLKFHHGDEEGLIGKVRADTNSDSEY